jgi:predicted transcriptional regulator YdeE
VFDEVRAMRLFIFSATVVAIAVSMAGQNNPPRKIHQEEFSIVGIEARTTNAHEMKGDGVIPAQWQKWQDRLNAHLKGPPEIQAADSNLYAVYTDYTSDRNGEYSFVIGLKAGPRATVPEGMVVKKIPAGDYAVITSENGPVSKVVPSAWMRVWALEDHAQLGGARAYKSDFEVYDGRSRDPQHSQVVIYVGLE